MNARHRSKMCSRRARCGGFENRRRRRRGSGEVVRDRTSSPTRPRCPRTLRRSRLGRRRRRLVRRGDAHRHLRVRHPSVPREASVVGVGVGARSRRARAKTARDDRRWALRSATPRVTGAAADRSRGTAAWENNPRAFSAKGRGHTHPAQVSRARARNPARGNPATVADAAVAMTRATCACDDAECAPRVPRREITPRRAQSAGIFQPRETPRAESPVVRGHERRGFWKS